MGRPYFATPTEVHTSFMVLGFNVSDSSTEKNPVLKRGCGVSSFFPPLRNIMKLNGHIKEPKLMNHKSKLAYTRCINVI